MTKLIDLEGAIRADLAHEMAQEGELETMRHGIRQTLDLYEDNLYLYTATWVCFCGDRIREERAGSIAQDFMRHVGRRVRLAMEATA